MRFVSIHYSLNVQYLSATFTAVYTGVVPKPLWSRLWYPQQTGNVLWRTVHWTALSEVWKVNAWFLSLLVPTAKDWEIITWSTSKAFQATSIIILYSSNITRLVKKYSKCQTLVFCAVWLPASNSIKPVGKRPLIPLGIIYVFDVQTV